MTQSVALLLYAGILGVLMDRWLMQATWQERSPRSALFLWHATALGVLTSLGWAMILLAHDAAEHGFAAVLRADKSLLHAAYAGPGEIPWYWNLSLVLVICGLVAASVVAIRRLVLMRRVSGSHHLAATRMLVISLADEPDNVVGVVDTVMPAIYCLGAGGRRHLRIHVTTGALRLLDDEELRAAVTHERGHLNRHHHRTLVVVDALSAAVGWMGLLRSYPSSVRRLIELEADDYAAARCGRLTVARALLAMSTSRDADLGPATSHSWIGGDPARRIRRLVHNGPMRRDAARLVCGVGATLLVLTPLASSVGPALSLIGTAGVVSQHNEPAPGFDHH